jgi:imidazolonepropionase
MNVRLVNIGELVVVPPGPVAGSDMRSVQTLAGAELHIADGRIAAFGPAGTLEEAPAGCDIIDAEGGCVTPGLIDCHTHTVFAGTRENEFVQRIQGKSYAQIAAAGGGIKATVKAVRQASKERLVELALPRLRRMLAAGVTTVEIKSGYGLTLADERKMLEAIRELKTLQHIELVPTYLAAHVVPTEWLDNRQSYLEAMYADDVLRDLRENGLAEFGDVFCEGGAYTPKEARLVAEACRRNGLGFKIHSEQLSNLGGTRMAAEMGAVSADHLECVDDHAIEAMKAAGTIPVVLPGCSLFLDSEPAPARLLIDDGLPVALATDLNPGSSMIESLPLVMSYACVRLRMTPIEALVACTANAAAALSRQDRMGGIAVGMQADLIVLDAPNVDAWLCQVGRNCVRGVLKRGRPVVEGAV